MIEEGELIRVMFTEKGSFPLSGCRVELTAGHVPTLTPVILFKEGKCRGFRFLTK
jgi:hypothetical protein